MVEWVLAACTIERPLASPRRQSVTTASYVFWLSFSIASWAEVDGVTWCPAASRMAHLSVTMFGSSSTQRILAIRVILGRSGLGLRRPSLQGAVRPHHFQLARYC